MKRREVSEWNKALNLRVKDSESIRIAHVNKAVEIREVEAATVAEMAIVDAEEVEERAEGAGVATDECLHAERRH